MTASFFVTGTRVAWIGRPVGEDDPATDRLGVEVLHAVARPVVDGLESSVCGMLVTATAADDWLSVRAAARCEECARIAG